MEKLLYYPSFFIQDEGWLKFALLYMSDISTIVPDGAESHLTEVHNKVLKHTDLLSKYNPDYEEKIDATRKVLEKIDSELNGVFSRYTFSRHRESLVETWRNPNFQNFELFSSKFSYQLETYCLENGFAQKTKNGIRVNEEIGNRFMAILADEIASRKNMSIITDIKDHKSKKTLIRNPYYSMRLAQTNKAVRDFIELKIPMNLEEIQLEDIINLRNKESYQQKLKEFQQLVDMLINQSNYQINENTPLDIEGQLVEGQKGLAWELLDLGIALTGTVMGITCSFGGTIPEQLREGLGVGSVATSLRPLHERFQERNRRRKAASFVTDISNLQRKANHRKVIGRNS